MLITAMPAMCFGMQSRTRGPAVTHRSYCWGNLFALQLNLANCYSMAQKTLISLPYADAYKVNSLRWLGKNMLAKTLFNNFSFLGRGRYCWLSFLLR